MKFSPLLLTAAIAQLAAAASNSSQCISSCIKTASTSVNSQPHLVQTCTTPDSQNRRTCEIDLCFSSWNIRDLTEQCMEGQCKDAIPELKKCNQTYEPDQSLVENTVRGAARAGGLLAVSGVAFAFAMQYI